jgi:AbrB family looped-hinge helix DNA binding protein
MQSVTVSPKYQVVIPKNVRKALKLHPGQKMQIVEYAGRIELIPERDIKELRGSRRYIGNRSFKTEHGVSTSDGGQRHSCHSTRIQSHYMDTRFRF